MPSRPPKLNMQVAPTMRSKREDSPSKGMYGSRWQRARAAYLKVNPLCVMCGEDDITTAATVVDHITPHGGDYDLFWAQDNWQPLCTHHHASTKQKAERRGGRGRGGAKV